eukprot:10117056-Alexandrium_andersonii.AAC.1
MSGGATESPPDLIQVDTRLSEASQQALHHPRAHHRQLQHPQRRQQRSCCRAPLCALGPMATTRSAPGGRRAPNTQE